MTTTSLQHAPVIHCHNCGAAVDYHYCALCGQETRLHVPSAGEFVHEFVGHYVALEGRLWKTLACLLFKPGMLTAEYIAGRRARYVQPLRVYLTLSILFFALLKVLGPQLANFDDVKPPPPKAAVEADAVVLKTGVPVVDQALRGAGAKFIAFMAKPAAERTRAVANGFFAYVPYAMFCLMPLFALYLKLLYLGSGRYYGEHLLFALHANAFAFAMFCVMILTSPLNWGLLAFAQMLWLVLYLPKAMQRVYGGARWRTGLRWLVLSSLHLLSIAAALLAVAGQTVMH